MLSLELDRMVQHWRANPAHSRRISSNTTRDALQFDGKVTEDVYAAYLMGDVDWAGSTSRRACVSRRRD